MCSPWGVNAQATWVRSGADIRTGWFVTDKSLTTSRVQLEADLIPFYSCILLFRPLQIIYLFLITKPWEIDEGAFFYLFFSFLYFFLRPKSYRVLQALRQLNSEFSNKRLRICESCRYMHVSSTPVHFLHCM